MGFQPERIVYVDRVVYRKPRKPIQVPTWLAIVILVPILYWAALYLIALENGTL